MTVWQSATEAVVSYGIKSIPVFENLSKKDIDKRTSKQVLKLSPATAEVLCTDAAWEPSTCAPSSSVRKPLGPVPVARDSAWLSIWFAAAIYGRCRFGKRLADTAQKPATSARAWMDNLDGKIILNYTATVNLTSEKQIESAIGVSKRATEK